MSGPKKSPRISVLFNKSGFGLAEAMTAIGIIGVLVTVIISQQKVSVKGMTTIASDTTINDVTRMVLNEVTDQATCTLNFGNQIKTETYTELKNSKTSQVFLKTGNSYGIGGSAIAGNKTVLGEVQLSNIDTLPAIPNNQYSMILRLKFKRKDGAGGIFSSNTVTRDIALNTVMDTTDTTKIASCFGDFSSLAQSAIKAACLQDALPSGLAQAAKYLEPSPALTAAGFPYGKCVHDAGDIDCTSTGGVLQKVESIDGKPSYTCGALESSCPIAGQFITGFNTFGSPICEYPFPQCAVDQVITRSATGVYKCVKIDCSGTTPIKAFAGFDANGDLICNPITTANACPDSYATSITTSGSVVCSQVLVQEKTCPPNQRVNSIDSSGMPVCTPFINLAITCPAGQAVKSIDASGNAVCGVIERPLRCGTTPVRSHIDCQNAGGTPAYLGNSSQSQCFFAGGTCPAPWVRCGSWTVQQAGSCTDVSSTWYCNGWVQTRSASNGNGVGSGTPGVNTTALQSTPCYRHNGIAGTGNPGNCSSTTAGAPVATTAITHVGCY